MIAFQVCIYRCLIDIAAGMDSLHSVGVLHGDLKAANVLCKSTATDPRGFTCKVCPVSCSVMTPLVSATQFSRRVHAFR